MATQLSIQEEIATSTHFFDRELPPNGGHLSISFEEIYLHIYLLNGHPLNCSGGDGYVYGPDWEIVGWPADRYLL